MARNSPTIGITLTIDPAQWADAKKRLGAVAGGANRAAAAALNRAVTGIRTDAVRAVTGAYTIKAADARQTLSISRASRSHLLASLTSRGSSIPLHAFRVTPRTVTNPRPGGGVRASVRKGSSGKLRQAFIVRNLSVGSGFGRATGVAMRVGQARHPIRPLYGPSVPAMLSKEEQLGPLQESAGARLFKALAHEIKRLEAGYGA